MASRARHEGRDETHAQHFGVGDRRDIDGAPRIHRKPGEFRLGLRLECLGHRARRIHRQISNSRGRPRALAPPRHLTAFEVVPESREPRVRGVQLRKPPARIIGFGLRRIKPRLDFLTARELAAVMLGQMLASLTLVQLAREVGDKLLDEFAPQLP